MWSFEWSEIKLQSRPEVIVKKTRPRPPAVLIDFISINIDQKWLGDAQGRK